MTVLRSSLANAALRTDVLLAGAVTLFAAIATPHAAGDETAPRAMDIFGIGLVVLAGLPLTVRRIVPVGVALATSALVTTYLAAGYAFGPILLLLFIAMYTVADECPPRTSLVVVGVGVTAVVLGSAARVGPDVLWIGWYVAPWSLGAFVRQRREAARRVREEAKARAAYEERLLIAREVHDVVGHGLSVIAMQAGVALHVLDRRPERARESLESILATSREALDGLRATLATFRGDAGQRTPVPGIADIERLIDGVRAAGIPVELVVAGERRDVPAAVGHAAYRIVQESLTNVVRHAGPTSATVTFDYNDDRLDVSVQDDGVGPRGPVTGGEGVAGMRERAEGLGGTFTAGPSSAGGFRVEAQLPTRWMTVEP